MTEYIVKLSITHNQDEHFEQTLIKFANATEHDNA